MNLKISYYCRFFVTPFLNIFLSIYIAYSIIFLILYVIEDIKITPNNIIIILILTKIFGQTVNIKGIIFSVSGLLLSPIISILILSKLLYYQTNYFIVSRITNTIRQRFNIGNTKNIVYDFRKIHKYMKNKKGTFYFKTHEKVLKRIPKNYLKVEAIKGHYGHLYSEKLPIFNLKALKEKEQLYYVKITF